MSLMSKSLIVLSVLSLFAFAYDMEKRVVNFQKKRLPHHIKALEVQVMESLPVKSLEGWNAYFTKMVIAAKEGKSDQKKEIFDVVFANDKVIALDLIHPEQLQSYKKLVHPTMPKSAYDAHHLIAGNHDAPHKLVLFSDPVCPFCMDNVPGIIDFVKQHPKKLALYYYHLPLAQIHPAAPTLCKALIVAEKKGIKNITKRTYEGDFEYKESASKKILEAFNTQMKTKLTLAEINADWVKEQMEKDIEFSKRMFVTGTPTLFTDGKKDISREAYKEVVK